MQWNSSESVKTGCIVIWHFFGDFKAKQLNENDILAIIEAKYAENHTIFDWKRSFLRYFNFMSERLITTVQISPKILIAEMRNMVNFEVD